MGNLCIGGLSSNFIKSQAKNADVLSWSGMGGGDIQIKALMQRMEEVELNHIFQPHNELCE